MRCFFSILYGCVVTLFGCNMCVVVPQTPLHYAAASTHGAMCLELLVNAKAETNIKVRTITSGILCYTVSYCHFLSRRQIKKKLEKGVRNLCVF